MCAGTVLAQVQDPTRPPVLPETPGGPGGEAAAADSGAQTVILRRAGKPAAVVNGQYVAVGDRLGDRKVLRITEDEVVLGGPGGREVIKRTPGVEKKPAGKTPAKRQDAGAREK